MSRMDLIWGEPLALDVGFGYLGSDIEAPRRRHPRVVLNGTSDSVLRILREELTTCSDFLFSVAFVSPRAIALLKQEFIDYQGTGCIVTSDYLAFNSPGAFQELLNLTRLGIDVRVHSAEAFHPKGYLFRHEDSLTAMVGSSNLTESALVTNHEWNLKVTAALGSDLAGQFKALREQQIADSAPLTAEWIAGYAASYVAPPPRRARSKDARRPDGTAAPGDGGPPVGAEIRANRMQQEALEALARVREAGERRAIVISATGTGKTILSALDARNVGPERLLFVVHREQILDRTMREYRRVMGGPLADFGKLSGTAKDFNARFLFATVQTLGQPDVLRQLHPEAFDYVVFDEAHRAAAAGHRRVLDHFKPDFLLGMTATPERMDGFNVFELFDFNVPYEIRLNRALEEDMLAPFHYFGVADVTFADGHTLTEQSDLSRLISPDRVDHLIRALELYGQASVPPRGLIFCSRKEEAHRLAAALNARSLRGRPLRVRALTGEDPIPVREAAVEQLERGDLDYILTVDVFNEGVDIPTINQIVMLRQTQSSIVFVQQLGRGLRKAAGKDHIIVLDFIGNYANNYLIPVALFGDESLNKESLRQQMIAAEEAGVLPGLASVRFDKISQERVLRSITAAKLDSMANLKKAIELLRNRLGKVPALMDFLRFDSVDPVVLATRGKGYPALVERLLKIPAHLTARERSALDLLSNEVMTAKRGQEFLALKELMERGHLTSGRLSELFAANGLASDSLHVQSVVDTFTLAGHSEMDQSRYERGLALQDDTEVHLDPDVERSYRESPSFKEAVDDIVATGAQLVQQRYATGQPFVQGRQYSRKEVTRLLCWPRKWTSTLYGYRVNRETGTCAIFVTLHKADDVAASTAYEDALLDPSSMLWYTRSRRTLQSDEVRAIVDNEVALYVFVKKDDAEGSEFYFLGAARSEDAEQTTMPDAQGTPLDVVRMRLHFEEPIQSALFDYFHPTVTA